MFFNGKASGRAWVTFDDESFAAKALEMDQMEMLGRLLEVSSSLRPHTLAA
jgi:hypothetical protein